MGEMGNSEPAKFLPFHFVKFASLTSLVKDNGQVTMFRSPMFKCELDLFGLDQKQKVTLQMYSVGSFEIILHEVKR